MSDSRKELIIQNVISTIASITKSNGYENDIPAERIFRARSEVNVVAFPSVFVFEGDEIVVEREMAGEATRVYKDLEIQIVVLCSGYVDLAQKINLLEGEIVRAMISASDRGGYAEYTEETGSIPFYNEGENIGGRTQTFNVRYGHRESNPFTA
jgi:hypothetical protein